MLYRQKVLLIVLMLAVYCVLQAQNTHLPYFNGFENPSDTVGWTFKVRPKTSGFEVGSAVHCLGYKSMYISPDTGRTATYIVTSSGYVSVAYTSFTLPAGDYTLAFDYQCGGDGTNQNMMVGFVPSSTAVNAAALGTDFPNAIKRNMFVDNTNNSVFGSSAWRHITGTIHVQTAGTYNLCFAFRCNSRTVVNPGACVDNIQLDTAVNETDCTYPPYGITVVKDAQAGAIVCWQGNATEYEVMAASASNPLDYSYAEHTGVTTTCDTFQYAELGEGQYFFYVRPICNGDTGIYGEISGVLMYDVSAHCIDFITFNAAGTQCTYGTYTNPYQTNGFIDNGPSQMSSRHTIHTDLNETDPRSNGALHTVPAGDVMSVRLGNWNNGSEGEAVTYTYNVPAGSNLILMMKYAIVFEEPGHTQPPEFLLEIMDVNGSLLDRTCTKANFLCDGTLTQGWHSCQASGSYGSLSTIWWKQWTTIGVNLTQYAGQTIKIRLTTKDCNASGHFGYAYYTLNCTAAEITGMSCGEQQSTEIKAPDGFNYRWTNNCTGQTVGTSQSLPVAGTDTCSYTCRCTYKEQSTCYFDLVAYTIPRLPEAKFTYNITYSDCQTHISFTNTSEVYIMKDGVKTYMPTEKITSQTWKVTSKHTGRSYVGTFTAKNLPTINVPKEGDTITIWLQAVSNGCDDDTTIVIAVPPLQESHGITDRYVCLGDKVQFNGEDYRFITADSIEITGKDGKPRYITGQKSVQVIDTLKSWCGCDSILELNLSALITDTMHIDTVICSDQPFCIQVKNGNGVVVLDTCPHQTGHYRIPVASSLKTCDSLFFDVKLQVLDVLDVDVEMQQGQICADDDTFMIKYNTTVGTLAGYRIVYDAKAKAAGFEDTPDTVSADGQLYVPFSIPQIGEGWNGETGSGKYVKPDNYQATVTFYNSNSLCNNVVKTIDFTVQYPKDVIAQRWNDFLGVRNKEYNGGYDFVEYEWYVDGAIAATGKMNMSQYYEEGQKLDPNKTYQVKLMRVGENYGIMTCGFKPVMYDDASVETGAVISLREGSKEGEAKMPARCHAYIYTMSGLYVGEYDFEEGVNGFGVQDMDGVYLMKVIYEDGGSEVIKFMVK